MKANRFSLVLGAALALSGASAAYASPYLTTATGLRGDFNITGFGAGDTDGNPNTYTISLSNLSGVLNVNVPLSGSYAVDRLGSFVVNYGGATPIGVNSASWVPLGSTSITTSGITGSNFIYDFTNNTFTSDGVDVKGLTNTFSGDISTIKVLLGSMFGPLANLLQPGKVSVSHVLTNGTWVIDVTESEKVNEGFNAVLAALDTNNFTVLGDGRITGDFVANGFLRFVPEPTSMALLGLGLAGMAALRRRRAA